MTTMEDLLKVAEEFDQLKKENAKLKETVEYLEQRRKDLCIERNGALDKLEEAVQLRSGHGKALKAAALTVLDGLDLYQSGLETLRKCLKDDNGVDAQPEGTIQPVSFSPPEPTTEPDKQRYVSWRYINGAKTLGVGRIEDGGNTVWLDPIEAKQVRETIFGHKVSPKQKGPRGHKVYTSGWYCRGARALEVGKKTPAEDANGKRLEEAVELSPEEAELVRVWINDRRGVRSRK